MKLSALDEGERSTSEAFKTWSIKFDADALPGCPVSCGQCRWRDQVKDLVVVGKGPGAGCGARRGYLRPGHGTEGEWF